MVKSFIFSLCAEAEQQVLQSTGEPQRCIINNLSEGKETPELDFHMLSQKTGNVHTSAILATLSFFSIFFHFVSSVCRAFSVLSNAFLT